MGQLSLLRTRRFAGIFWTQFFGAFNDNLLKNALVILVAFQGGALSSMDAGLFANLAGGLFVLPYLLFSGVAGQLADRHDKAAVVRLVKVAELAIMALAAVGFARGDVAWLLAALFLMGVHSAFFAPAKYGLLPQVLRDTELVGGNALVEMGTFVAILLGNVAGGLLIAIPGEGPRWVAIAAILFSMTSKESAPYSTIRSMFLCSRLTFS